MSIFSNHKKPIASLLILAIFTSLILGPVVLLYPKKAKAIVVPVSDSMTHALLGGIAGTTGATAAATGVTSGIKVWEKAEWWLDLGMRTLGELMLRQVLAMITNDIINWINGGGRPRFVSDWKGFLADAADAAAGAFIDEYLGMGWLCEPFDLDIKIALLPEPRFEERVRCTLSDIVDNIEDFYEDFTKGGWQAWVRLVEPRNNIYGAYLLALDAKMGAAAAAREAAEKEALAGQGFLGARDESGRIVTPGRLVSELAGKAVTQELDLLREQIADLTDALGPYQIYVMAIANALINRVIREGFALIGIGAETATRWPSQTEYERYQTGAIELSDLSPLPPGESYPSGTEMPLVAVYALSERDLLIAENLYDHQVLLRENLRKLQAEQRLSLDVLRDIKDTQVAILETLQSRYVNGLDLPTWALVEEPFPNNIQISNPSIGRIGLTRTAEATYILGTPQPQAQTRINELEASGGDIDDINQLGANEIDNWINAFAEPAIRSSHTLIATINNFLNSYNAGASERALRDIQNRMERDKVTARDAAQNFILSETTDIYYLSIETETAAGLVNLRTNTLETARGTQDNPVAGTLYGELAELEEKLKEIQ